MMMMRRRRRRRRRINKNATLTWRVKGWRQWYFHYLVI